MSTPHQYIRKDPARCRSVRICAQWNGGRSGQRRSRCRRNRKPCFTKRSDARVGAWLLSTLVYGNDENLLRFTDALNLAHNFMHLGVGGEMGVTSQLPSNQLLICTMRSSTGFTRAGRQGMMPRNMKARVCFRVKRSRSTWATCSTLSASRSSSPSTFRSSPSSLKRRPSTPDLCAGPGRTAADQR